MAENWTIDSVKSALAAKKISARELAKDYFSRIAAKNPQLNAYLALSEERAYAQADRVDAMVAAGKPLPPLAGVPVAVKDVLSTRGVHNNLRLENFREVRAALRRHRRFTAGKCRRGDFGQNQLRRIRNGQLQRKFRVRPRAQSRSARSHSRRLQRRLGGGRRCGSRRRFARNRYRRIDSPARRHVRRARDDGQLRPRLALRIDRVRLARSIASAHLRTTSKMSPTFCK